LVRERCRVIAGRDARCYFEAGLLAAWNFLKCFISRGGATPAPIVVFRLATTWPFCFFFDILLSCWSRLTLRHADRQVFATRGGVPNATLGEPEHRGIAQQSQPNRKQ
jgi:hypothetical protein